MKKNLLTLLTSFLLVLGVQTITFAQTNKGIIRGQITDAENGEVLIGATVVIKGTTIGAATDLDGKYQITVEAGTYDLEVAFVSYQTKTITGVEVKAGDVTLINATLGGDQELEAVVVEAKIEQNSTTAVLAAQKNSGVVQDGLAAEQIARSGDRDVAAAASRITGVTIEGGKYVYVRGLGDRYSQTTLNGASLPSLDPNRNSVQMDLFPSNLIDNVIVSKTFSPDHSGSFAGGNINIVTKDFPDRFIFQWNSSLGFNDQASFNPNFLSYEGGKLDFLAFDDGKRALPSPLKNGGLRGLSGQERSDAINAFKGSFNLTRQSPILNQFHSFSLGNQKDVAGRPLGFVASLSYQRNYEYIEDGITGRYQLTGSTAEELVPLYDLTMEQGRETVLMGANLNMAYKLNATSKIALNMMHNRSSDKVADTRMGRWAQIMFNDDNIYQTQVSQFLERTVSSAQLKGKHALGKRNISIEWLSSFAHSTQDEPDLRFFSSNYVQNGDQTTYDINISSYPSPSRYYRDMNEINWDNRIDVAIPFTAKGGESLVKVGGGYLAKDRDFNEFRYNYTNTNAPNALTDFRQTGLLEDFQNNIGLVNGEYLIDLSDATDPANSYTGFQQVVSAYAMVDWKITKKLRTVSGLRYEGTDMETRSDNRSLPVGKVVTNDILPALNLIYSTSEKTNIRLSYGRTLARPTFREMAPFPSFDFVGDFILIGNPNLERTLIDNFDIRFENYPALSEIFSASAFYKRFSNPIERAFNPEAANGEVEFRNVDEATVMGVELEVRKRLDFSPALKNFSVGTNFSYMYSKVDIDPRELVLIRATDPDRKATRTMFMQSPYVLNSFVYYDLEEKGVNVSLNFNVFGKRLAYVTQGGQPDVFEVPRPSLDLSIKKNLAARWSASLRARNLLNPEYRLVQKFRGEEYTYSSYRIGRTVSLGINYLID